MSSSNSQSGYNQPPGPMNQPPITPIGVPPPGLSSSGPNPNDPYMSSSRNNYNPNNYNPYQNPNSNYPNDPYQNHDQNPGNPYHQPNNPSGYHPQNGYNSGYSSGGYRPPHHPQSQHYPPGPGGYNSRYGNHNNPGRHQGGYGPGGYNPPGVRDSYNPGPNVGPSGINSPPFGNDALSNTNEPSFSPSQVTGDPTPSTSSGDPPSTGGSSSGGHMRPPRPPTRPSAPPSVRGPTPPENSGDGTHFKQPQRPNVGRQGKTIMLKANFFRVEMPSDEWYHYEIDIKPDKCPRRVNRDIVAEMVQNYQENIFSNSRPVYDGRKNIFTTFNLPIPREGCNLEVKLPSDGRERIFNCTIKFKTRISLYTLKMALESKLSDIPFEAVQALDVVMRHLPSMRYTPVGRSFFSQPVGRHSQVTPALGGGREVWFGFHQSIRPSQWKMMLNIDVSATAFYKSQPVIKFLAEVLEMRNEDELLNCRALTDAQRIKFSKEIRGLKVEINHCGSMKRKYWV